jgi:cation diffusion facilitator CzcD-associated flavoprotein CzcO
MWGAYVEPRADPTRQVVHPWRWRGEADGRKELRPARRRLRLLGENSDIGGLWNADMPGAAVYDTTHLVSSKRMSGFVGFPMTADPPGYPSQLEALEYLRAYAWAHLELNADVERAKCAYHAERHFGAAEWDSFEVKRGKTHWRWLQSH